MKQKTKPNKRNGITIKGFLSYPNLQKKRKQTFTNPDGSITTVEDYGTALMIKKSDVATVKLIRSEIIKSVKTMGITDEKKYKYTAKTWINKKLKDGTMHNMNDTDWSDYYVLQFKSKNEIPLFTVEDGQVMPLLLSKKKNHRFFNLDYVALIVAFAATKPGAKYPAAVGSYIRSAVLIKEGEASAGVSEQGSADQFADSLNLKKVNLEDLEENEDAEDVEDDDLEDETLDDDSDLEDEEEEVEDEVAKKPKSNGARKKSKAKSSKTVGKKKKKVSKVEVVEEEEEGDDVDDLLKQAEDGTEDDDNDITEDF